MLLDTDVMIDVLRRYPPAIAWLAGLNMTSIGLPGFVAMELLQGCRTLLEQQRLERQLSRFATYWPSAVDCQRALRDFSDYRLSHNLGLLDALIGQTSVGRGDLLATFNVKHFSVIRGLRTSQLY